MPKRSRNPRRRQPEQDDLMVEITWRVIDGPLLPPGTTFVDQMIFGEDPRERLPKLRPRKE